VKRVDHTLNFSYSVKTWHEKLGNLGIRKTIKNEEWGKVYRHCAHYRLEDPSRKRGDKRLKRTKRKTEVILGNRTFKWDQAWKNMKRAGAIVEPQLGEFSSSYFQSFLLLNSRHRSPQPPSPRYHRPNSATRVVAAESAHVFQHLAATRRF
jgi:superfamily II DNA helicase RecQ